MPKDDTVNPTVSAGVQPSITMPPVLPDDIMPPVLPDDVKPDVKTTVIEDPKTDTGSAAPSNDIVMPMQEISSTPRKKFAGGKVIATILGLFLLVGGVGAGVYLTGQNQDIREEASSCYDECRIESGSRVCDCRCNGICTRPDYEDDPQSPNNPVVTPAPQPNDECTYQSIVNNVGVQNCTTAPVINQSNCPGCTIRCGQNTCEVLYPGGGQVPGSEFRITGSGGGNEPEPTPNPTPTPTATPLITASCQNLKAYSTTSNTEVPLTTQQLSALQPGNQFNLCVQGIKTGGSFDKVRFTINGVLQPEQTMTDMIGHTNEGRFCTLYTIPQTLPAGGVFTFKAEMHHITLGWK